MSTNPQAKYYGHFKIHYGPYGTSFACAHCDFYVFARKYTGRGKGAKARGQIIQHLKNSHSQLLVKEAQDG